MIRIDRLAMANFRCFSECQITFHRSLTVLVARNGKGKTAILDAITGAFAPFLNVLVHKKQSKGFTKDDLRVSFNDVVGIGPPTQNFGPLENGEMVNAHFVSVLTEAHLKNNPSIWEFQGDLQGTKLSTKRSWSRPLTEMARDLESQVVDSTVAPLTESLPLIAYFRAGRQLSRDIKIRSAPGNPGHDRFRGYTGALDCGSNYGTFIDWYMTMFRTLGRLSIEERNLAKDVTSRHQPAALLAAVNKAVDTVLRAETGWHGLHVDKGSSQLMLRHSRHGRLPLGFQSDGIRNTVAMVADTAHRCARLNPQFGEDAPSETPGILMIDEVDLHLHPEWQQSIIGALRDAFPKLQLIVSTHSPQVISTVDSESIRTMNFAEDQSHTLTPGFQTRGVRSSDILSAIMGVDPVPRVPESQLLSEYRAMIESGEASTPAAGELKQRLLSHFGQHHPIVLDCERLLRFSDFKRRRLSSGGTNEET
jgi:predicted ATP-binding protein involved in virulence